MTVHEEFLQILRVLLETPPSTGKEPPLAEKDQAGEGVSNQVTSDKKPADDKRRRAS